MVDFRRVVVHCSDTPNGADFRTDEINQWHLDNGWSGIGYHYVCELENLVNGRPTTRKGAHTRGENYDSLGICLIGRNNYSDRQWAMLAHLFNTFKDTYDIEAKDWHCHHEFNSLKTCPGFTAAELRGFLRGIELKA